MAYWLVKTEPDTYSFADLVREKRARWDGVRNPEAKKNLAAMKVGDEVIVYHTGSEKAAVGLATVVRTAYPDPTESSGTWLSVDLAAGKGFARAITLAEIKSHAKLRDMVLAKKPRLSVQPVTSEELKELIKLAK